MKVLNLQCEFKHSFEGWFSDEADYEQQTQKQQLRCPLCDSNTVIRLPSAPRLNLSAASTTTSSNASQSEALMNITHDTHEHQQFQQLQRAYLQAARELMSNTKDVGERFAEEARRMHYGEAAHEAIRGKATREEADALHEEGIAFMALPALPALKEPLQ